MKLLHEFKAFAVRGNVIDLAVGVVIGSAFGKIVSALVEKIIMPMLGFFTFGQNFSSLAVNLPTSVDGSTPTVAISYGAFIQAVADFVIIAFVIFLMVKAINKFLRKHKEEERPALTNQEILLAEIRVLLKAQVGENTKSGLPAP